LIFFRSDSFEAAWYVCTHLFRGLPSDVADLASGRLLGGLIAPVTVFNHLLAMAATMAFEAAAERRAGGDDMALLRSFPPPVRYACYYGLTYGALLAGGFGHPPFLYFQF